MTTNDKPTPTPQKPDAPPDPQGPPIKPFGDVDAPGKGDPPPPPPNPPGGG